MAGDTKPAGKLCQNKKIDDGRLWCVTGEDKVARFDGLVAGKAGVGHNPGGGFAVIKLSEPPTAGRVVLS
jgi:hypothetical protein